MVYSMINTSIIGYIQGLLPMGELSENVKQLCGYLNQVFSGGVLFLVTTEAKLKRLLMELTGDLLRSDECRHISATRMIGLNSFPDREDSVWVFSPEVIIALDGAVLTDEDSPVLWLERPLGFTNAQRFPFLLNNHTT